MKSVRAKFKVESITKSSYGTSVKMHPVHSGSEENKSFSDYTPAGNIDMLISPGKPAAEMFEVGKEFYIDFTAAE